MNDFEQLRLRLPSSLKEEFSQVDTLSNARLEELALALIAKFLDTKFSTTSDEIFNWLTFFCFSTQKFDLLSKFYSEKWNFSCSINLYKKSDLPAQVVLLNFHENSLTTHFNDSFLAQDNCYGQLIMFNWTFALFSGYLTSPGRISGPVHLSLWDNGLYPGLSYCGNKVNQFLIPDSLFLSTRGYQNVRETFAKNNTNWDSRSDEVFWRGASTGLNPQLPLSLPRVKLCNFIKDNNLLDYDVGLSSIVQLTNSDDIQAIENCQILKDVVHFSKNNSYKYHIDIDGNTNSWPGLFQKLLSGGVVFKIESEYGFSQWYYPRLKPWFNFVPVSSSFLDLDDKVRFIKKNPKLAEEIGRNGRFLSESITLDRAILDSVNCINSAIHFTKYLLR